MNDREPPAFPRVSDAPADEKTVASGSIFGKAEDEPRTSSNLTDTPPPSTSPMTARDYRARWAVVGVATLVVVALVVAFLFLSGPKGGTPSTVARYAPADSVTYFEVRLDLPGDQHDGLAAFMSHFPGFADQAAFDQKLDETLSQLLQSTESGLSWQTDIEPWFGGQVGLFSSTVSPEPGTPPSMTAVLSAKDATNVELFMHHWTHGPDVTHEQHEGISIWTATLPGATQRVSLAENGEVFVAGSRIEDVKAALDAGANRATGLADDAFFLQQLGALPADYLGLVYYDGRAAAQQLRDQLDQLGSGDLSVPFPTGMIDWVIDAAAARSMAELRAEGDHLAMTTRSERPANADLPPLPGNRATTLAETAPADALVYAEVRDVGQTIGFVLGKLLEPAPGASPGLDLSGFQGLLGTPIQSYFDFIIDIGASVSFDGENVSAGVVATVDDSALATARVERLLTLARSLMQFGGGVTFTEQQHGDVTITVIGFEGDGGAGGPGGIGGVSVAVANGRLYVGMGDFVVDALDRTRAASLAARPEFQSGVQAGGANNAGVVFVDIAGLRGIVESTMSSEMRTDYELNQKPFVAPLSHMVVVNTTQGSTSVGNVFVFVE
jgi:hypothetical protein